MTNEWDVSDPQQCSLSLAANVTLSNRNAYTVPLHDSGLVVCRFGGLASIPGLCCYRNLSKESEAAGSNGERITTRGIALIPGITPLILGLHP